MKGKKRMKWTKGQKVKYRGATWTVCDGGFSDPFRKVRVYKLSRGAWKRLVSGNCITSA